MRFQISKKFFNLTQFICTILLMIGFSYEFSQKTISASHIIYIVLIAFFPTFFCLLFLIDTIS